MIEGGKPLQNPTSQPKTKNYVLTRYLSLYIAIYVKIVVQVLSTKHTVPLKPLHSGCTTPLVLASKHHLSSSLCCPIVLLSRERGRGCPISCTHCAHTHSLLITCSKKLELSSPLINHLGASCVPRGC